MDQFVISQLQQFSGIKAHTIRIWEKRYSALSPGRSDGNTRHYDNAQLRRLLNIVSLLESGYKLPELSSMTDEEMFLKLRTRIDSHPAHNKMEYYISQLIAAGTSYDEPWFDKLLSHCIVSYGLQETYVNVIYPLLVRVGLMWTTDNMPPASEHFISNLIKQKLYAAIDGLPPARHNDESWLLFLPENEFHEIGLLFAGFMIRQAGYKLVYLGANIPVDTLRQAVKNISPANLLLFLVHFDVPEDCMYYLKTLQELSATAKLHISGNKKLLDQLSPVQGINRIHSVEELCKLFKQNVA